jgi:hypothetical protein
MKELTENEAISWALEFWEKRVMPKDMKEERQVITVQLVAGLYKSGGKVCVPATVGLSVGDIQRMALDGACAICKSGKWPGNSPHVDHDHRTGMVRGLLCVNCNIAVGMLGDSIENARAVVDYLLKHERHGIIKNNGSIETSNFI